MNSRWAKNFAVFAIAAAGLGLGLWTRQAPSQSVARKSRPTLVLTRSSVESSPLSEDENKETPSTSDRADSDDSATSPSPASSSNATSNNQSQVVGLPRDSYSDHCINMLPAVAKPLEHADLSTPTDGVLWKLNVREGDEVDADVELAQIDSRITEASLRVAQAGAARKATLEVARIKLTLAEQYLRRIEQAHDQQAASGLELDEARSRVDEARAALEEGNELQREAEARLQLEAERLNSHKLRAPFRGTITRIKKNIGETLTRDAGLMTIVNLVQLRAELYVPVKYIEHFRSGSDAYVLPSLPNSVPIRAQVVHVDPIIDAATNTFRVVIEIANKDKQLPAGFALRLIDPAHDIWNHKVTQR